VKEFGTLPSGTHAGIVLLYDDTMSAYRVASALIQMVDTYPSRFVKACCIYSTNFLRLGFASGEPLGAKTSIKKPDCSAFGLAVGEPRSLRS